jgi:hypothetical protein
MAAALLPDPFWDLVEPLPVLSSTPAGRLNSRRVTDLCCGPGMRGGNRQIFIRRLDQVDQDEATPLRGTENALTCFFSPDGGALGFTVVGSELRTVSLADGLVVPLASDVDFGGGIAWGSDDRITFVRAGRR